MVFVFDNSIRNQQSSVLRQQKNGLTEEGVLQIFMQWQGISNVGKLQAEKQLEVKHCCQISRTISYGLWRWTPNRAEDAIKEESSLTERSDLVAAWVVHLK